MKAGRRVGVAFGTVSTCCSVVPRVPGSDGIRRQALKAVVQQEALDKVKTRVTDYEGSIFSLVPSEIIFSTSSAPNSSQALGAVRGRGVARWVAGVGGGSVGRRCGSSTASSPVGRRARGAGSPTSPSPSRSGRPRVWAPPGGVPWRRVACGTRPLFFNPGLVLGSQRLQAAHVVVRVFSAGVLGGFRAVSVIAQRPSVRVAAKRLVKGAFGHSVAGRQFPAREHGRPVFFHQSLAQPDHLCWREVPLDVRPRVGQVCLVHPDPASETAPGKTYSCRFGSIPTLNDVLGHFT